jgi:aureolysin
LVLTYTAGSSYSLPGDLLCTQASDECTDGQDEDADAAHENVLDALDFYGERHGRLSLDDAARAVVSSVDYCPLDYYGNIICPWSNAAWTGTQMVYGDGFSIADDVAGHELTHGVT